MSQERFDPQYLAYLQRVRDSARALPLPNEPIPASARVCWYCVARGDLNEALNEISIQGHSQLKSYDEAINRLQSVKDREVDIVSEKEFMAIKEELNRETLTAELLEAEYLDLEKQLELEMVEVSALNESHLAAQNRVTIAQEALDSVEVKLRECKLQIDAMPRSIHELWSDFFPIEDHLTYATIHGTPLACLSKGEGETWSSTSRDALNVTAAMILTTTLLGRLTTLITSPAADLLRDRPYRILTTPTSIESRTGNPRTSFTLIPFVNDKPQTESWTRGLRLLADYIALLFKCLSQKPVHSLPSSSDGDSFYLLDPSRPDIWNKKMRHLLLNVLALRNLRFPPS